MDNTKSTINIIQIYYYLNNMHNLNNFFKCIYIILFFSYLYRLFYLFHICSFYFFRNSSRKSIIIPFVKRFLILEIILCLRESS